MLDRSLNGQLMKSWMDVLCFWFALSILSISLALGYWDSLQELIFLFLNICIVCFFSMYKNGCLCLPISFYRPLCIINNLIDAHLIHIFLSLIMSGWWRGKAGENFIYCCKTASTIHYIYRYVWSNMTCERIAEHGELTLGGCCLPIW